MTDCFVSGSGLAAIHVEVPPEIAQSLFRDVQFMDIGGEAIA
jgi:hypothetical protein